MARYYSDHLGGAEFQATDKNPHALALQGDRTCGMLGLPHKHEMRKTTNGTVEFVVRDGTGAEHIASWPEFAGYVAGLYEMLHQEWPQIITHDIWPIVWPIVRPALDREPLSIVESVKHAVHAQLVAFVDEFDFSKTLYSWTIERAHAFVERHLRAERDAREPTYTADGTGNERAALTLEPHQAAEPLAQLSQQERTARSAELFAQQRRNIKKLPVEQREVARLRLLEGKTLQETATRLGIHLQTAAYREKAAQKKLAKMLSPSDKELWRELIADEPTATDSHTDTSCIVRDRREKFAALPDVDFDKYVSSLPADEQRRIRDAADQHADDHRVKAGQLARVMYERPSSDTGDAGGRASSQQNRAPLVDRTDKIHITDKRHAELSEREIDMGTRPGKRESFDAD